MSETPIEKKPTGWEFLTFIAQVQEGLKGYDSAYHDFLNGVVDLGGDQVTDTTGQDIRARMEVSGFLVEKVSKLLNPEIVTKAFGAPGESGDETTIHQFASGFVAGFGQLLQWGRDTRAVIAPQGWQPVYAAIANYVLEPLAEIHRFADDFEHRAKTIVTDIEAGRPPSTDMQLTLKITIGDEQVAEFNRAFAAIQPPKKRGLFRRP